MIDHTGVIVSDFERSKSFYAAALKPIGYVLIYEFPAAVTGSTDAAGFGEPPKPDFGWAAAHPTNHLSMWRFAWPNGRWSMSFTPRRLPPAAGTMVTQVRGRNTIQTIMAHSF